MDDLIRRQDAVKSMTNAIWHYPNEMYAQLNSYEMAEALAKDGLMFIPSAQQWIPCAERLPEEDGTYFISGVWENGDVEVGQLQYIADEHRFSKVIYFNVKAWMPLPEPYKDKHED